MVYAGKELQNLIERYISYAQLQGVNIEQVWLHGAYSHGMPTRFDFLDLAIVTKEFIGGGIFRVTERLNIALDMLPDSQHIRLTAFHPDDYTEKCAEIRKNGHLVWEAGRSLKGLNINRFWSVVRC